ncbi:MAG: hypothetical protein ACRET4_04200 [Steroidobacteraceae bacterium]
MSISKAINPLFAKTLVFSLIVLALLIPLAQVELLVAERGAMRAGKSCDAICATCCRNRSMSWPS